MSTPLSIGAKDEVFCCRDWDDEGPIRLRACPVRS
jgi:hypothetical protein